MARADPKDGRDQVGTPPVLTGETRVDWTLWQLSSVLAEIAECNVRKENGNGAGTQSQTTDQVRVLSKREKPDEGSS